MAHNTNDTADIPGDHMEIDPSGPTMAASTSPPNIATTPHHEQAKSQATSQAAIPPEREAAASTTSKTVIPIRTHSKMGGLLHARWHEKEVAIVNVQTNQALTVRIDPLNLGHQVVYALGFDNNNINQKWRLHMVKEGDKSAWVIVNSAMYSKCRIMALPSCPYPRAAEYIQRS